MKASPARQMLDVEFLLARPQFSGLLIYLYRSGVLRKAMRELFRETKGAVSGPKPEDLLRELVGDSFFPAYNVTDWNSHISSDKTRETLSYLASKESVDCALFLPFDSDLTKEALWPKVLARSFVVEEPLLTRRTTPPVLRYLEATTDLACGVAFHKQRGFVQSFHALIGDRKAGLCDAMHIFDRLVLTQAEPESNIFTVAHEEEEDHRDTESLSESFAAFIVSNEPRTLPRFIVTLEDRRRRRRREETVMGDVYRMTERRLSIALDTLRHPNLSAMPPSRHARADFGLSEVLWAALLLAWESRILESSRARNFRAQRSPDSTMLRWEWMGRQFLARREGCFAGDPLTGVWSDLRHSFADNKRGDLSRLTTNRLKMLHTLSRYLAEAPECRVLSWLGKLNDYLATHLSKLAAEETHPSERPILTHYGAHVTFKASSGEPRIFGHLLGQTKALDGLGKKLCEGRHDGAIILHGPAGVGKRTLGRLVAKALLCEEPNESGSPCDRCDQCKAFNEGSSYGYTEFDATHGEPVETAREIVRTVQGGVLARRVVILIRNADLYEPQVADIFLKTLEARKKKATFVLLATSLKDMRVTVQSRSGAYRLRPLSHDKTMLLARKFSEERGLTVDDSVLVFLALASRGLPGELQRIVSELQAGVTIALSDVQLYLGYGWASELVAQLSAILDPRASLDERLSAISLEDTSQRLGLILHHIHGLDPHGRSEHCADPALLTLDKASWGSLSDKLNERARSQGLCPQALWRELVHCVISGDYCDARTAVAAGLASCAHGRLEWSIRAGGRRK